MLASKATDFFDPFNDARDITVGLQESRRSHRFSSASPSGLKQGLLFVHKVILGDSIAADRGEYCQAARADRRLTSR